MSSESIEVKDEKLCREIDAIYQSLRTECKTARSKNSIDIINKTCSEIAQGSRDFSTSLVGNLAKSKGGSSAQSISNKNDLVVTLTQSRIQSYNTSSHLTETDFDSLRSAIDPERLKTFGLKLGEGGSIENANGAEVFEIGFADAIGKIITIDTIKDG